MKKVLLCGHFSFRGHSATAGDFMVLDVVCCWLEGCNVSYDVALARPYKNGVNLQEINAGDYSHMVFLCGPFGREPEFMKLMDRFEGKCLIGLNLSMIEKGNYWNPFDLLLERDSCRTIRPDLALLCEQDKVPVVGVSLIHPQPEYGYRSMQKQANDALCRLVESRRVAVVDIDTCLDPSQTKLRSPRKLSRLSRVWMWLLLRLHGLVLALKNGVPVLAVDSVSGGAKVVSQAKAMGWSQVFTIDSLNDEDLRLAFEYCLTEGARQKAIDCRERAISQLSAVREEFMETIGLAPVERFNGEKKAETPVKVGKGQLALAAGFLFRKSRGLARRIMRHAGAFLVQRTDNRGLRLRDSQPDPLSWRSIGANRRAAPSNMQ